LANFFQPKKIRKIRKILRMKKFVKFEFSIYGYVYYAVQGHSRSPILLSNESSYATSY